MKRELFVGGLFALILGLLLATTLYVNDPGVFAKGDERFRMTARFRDVSGLTEGSEVWVYGTPGGRVTGIRPDGKGGVEVDLVLDTDPGIRMNAEVSVRSRSALGGAVVAIHPGTPDQPAWTGGVFEGRSVADAFQQISEVVGENREALKQTLENARKISKDLSDRSESIVANFEEFSKNAKTISQDLADGKGTLGKLLKEDALHTKLEEAVTALKKLGDDASGGGGTLDLLLHDKEMAANLKESAEKIRSLTTKLDAGEGTLGKLLNDPRPFDDLAATLADLRQLTSDARTGKGALSKLIYDEELGKRIDTISDDVGAITAKIRRGEGTLGKLVNDESVYNDLKAALKSLRAGSDDVRENAPVLTFAGFLFSGF